jgi:hypothetical protein
LIIANINNSNNTRGMHPDFGPGSPTPAPYGIPFIVVDSSTQTFPPGPTNFTLYRSESDVTAGKHAQCSGEHLVTYIMTSCMSYNNTGHLIPSLELGQAIMPRLQICQWLLVAGHASAVSAFAHHIIDSYMCRVYSKLRLLAVMA